MTDIFDTGVAGNSQGAQASPGLYVPRDIKRSRRTKAEIASVRDAIKDILEQDHPQTVRQVFYAVSVRGAIAKNETEYKRTVVRLLVDMREAGEIPFEWISDHTRWQSLHVAAKAIEAKGKPAFIYHLGDLDPSGVDAARDIEAKLRRYAPGAEIHFERPAVTREQVEQWNLPTRPTKQTDTRAKKFNSATSIELDAIPARQLRQLVRECIERHVDRHQLQILRAAEESERELLTRWAETYGGRP
jgi:hypothetical protein